MSSTQARNGHTTAGDGRLEATDQAAWERATRVVVTPLAAPSILGLFGFAAATFIVAAHLAGWYGDNQSTMFLFPFALAFGGIAQLSAAFFSFRARDAVAVAMHGAWGSFWIGFGILELLGAVGALTLPTGQFVEFGYWFLALAVITGFGAIAALGENLGITAVLATLAAGAAFAAIFYLTGSSTWETVAGWVLIASAVLAAYVAGAMMIAAAWGRTVLPLGEYSKTANIPGKKPPMRPIEFAYGEPGVKQGQ